MKYEISKIETEEKFPQQETAITPLEKTFLAEVNGKEVLLVYLVDTSASMHINDNIGQLCEGLKTLKRELMEDETARYTVKMVVIGYGNNAVIPVTDGIVPPDEFTPPELVAEGNTPMGQAYQTALKFIELWKQDCSKRKVDYFRPWLVNTTDGQPTDSWQDAAKALTKAEDNKQVVSWVVATEGANIPILKQISARRPVLYLRNLDYQSLFLWLSSSLAVVSNSDTDGRKPIDPVDSFADIY